MRQSKIFISILILLAIGLHAVPIFLRRGHTQISWPFLVWAMYKDSRPPGPITGRKSEVFAVTSTGMEEPVTSRLVGLPFGAVGRIYFQPMRDGDSAAARQLLDRINRNRSDRFVELRLKSEIYTVTDTGVVRNDNPVMTYRAEASESR